MKIAFPGSDFFFLFRHIVDAVQFTRSGKTIFDHDAVFWFGDLNFRLDTAGAMSNEELRQLCSDENAFRDMIVYDQVIFDGM